jgi:hypothetical protein
MGRNAQCSFILDRLQVVQLDKIQSPVTTPECFWPSSQGHATEPCKSVSEWSICKMRILLTHRIFTSSSLRSIEILSLYLCLVLSTNFYSRFPPTIVYPFLIFPHMLHVLRNQFVTIIIRGKDYKSRRPLTYISLWSSLIPPPWVQILSLAPCSQTHST